MHVIMINWKGDFNVMAQLLKDVGINFCQKRGGSEALKGSQGSICGYN